MSESVIIHVPVLVPSDPSRMIEYLNQLDQELLRTSRATGRSRTMVEKDFYRNILETLRVIFEPVRNELAARSAAES